MTTDTIAAIATAPGEAGIGIVRLSGPEALRCARTLFCRTPPLPPSPESHHAYYGYLAHPEDGDRLDDCLLTYFRGPRSYTGEDVVELACHGSNLVLGIALRALIRAGARLAEPGEFTQRAFLNGRLDLAAAESVIDVIRARTDAQLRVAVGQLSGRLSREISGLREALITLLAEIEAGIDFPDEIDPPEDAEVARRTREVRERCAALLATADAGRLYREGASVVLVGRPNVGKSSLLNALLGESRAIVTDVPGTTRDVIEESLNLHGIPVRVIDTAGLRETGDVVEALGVERTRQQVAAANLVLWVLDNSEGITEEDRVLAPELRDRPLLMVLNKSDLGRRVGSAEMDALAGYEVGFVNVAAKDGYGIPELQWLMFGMLDAGVPPESVWVSNARHESRLRTAAEALDRAIEAAEEGFHQAALALDLKLAAEALGEITGETVVEETISQIFARFCVGK